MRPIVSEKRFRVGKWSKGDDLEVDKLLANEGQFAEDSSSLIGIVAFEDKYNAHSTIRAAIHFSNPAILVQLPGYPHFLFELWLDFFWGRLGIDLGDR